MHTHMYTMYMYAYVYTTTRSYPLEIMSDNERVTMLKYIASTQLKQTTHGLQIHEYMKFL